MRGAWARAASLVPPVLLVGVALVQIALAHTRDLSPWLGGGFGMFATTDGRDWRHVHVTAERPGLVRDVPIPASLYDLSRRARAEPTRARLRALALRAADAEGVRTVSTFRIVLWRTRFEPRTLTPSSHALREVIVPAAKAP